MAAVFPSGIITLVFTDIEGSSDLWERHRAAFQPVLDEHNRLMREAALRWQGVEVKTEGDAFFLVFAKASDAVRFAVEAQLAFKNYPWSSLLPDLAGIRVRMGLHTGEPILGSHPDGTEDYFGPVVNRAARVGSAGHGGQIIISDAARSLSQGAMPGEITFQFLGKYRLKGVGQETLWQICHPELAHQFPPLKTLNPERHNLPAPVTPFIGREAQIRQWSQVLNDPGTRLLTLIGFGGLGKTRSALQLAELSIDEFTHGVWWVELDEARTGEDMLQRTAQALRIPLQPQPSVEEQLYRFLSDSHLLLVLDNTEQIADAAMVISGILSHTSRLKCLVTTRRALQISAERLVEIAPMALQDAISLFSERARARVPQFATTGETEADIAELCRRLEGVPLAIELATSRITLMTPRQMLGRLDEQLKLLQTRAPDLPNRQRALRAAIDWSYELLVDDDKALLSQLSVFAGGFTLHAAEAVADVPNVVEGITELRLHSFLRTETVEAIQENRFHMLTSVQTYALEKLMACGHDVAMRGRHAEYFLEFGEGHLALLRTAAEARALDELEPELDNLREAFHRLIAQDDKVGAARLAVTLHQYLHRLGFWAQAQALLQAGWEAVAQDLDNQKPARAALAYHMGSLAHDMGDIATAHTRAGESCDLYRQLNDAGGLADALNLMGLLALDGADYPAAEQHFRESLELRAGNDHPGRGIALHNLARLASAQHDPAASQTLYEEALTHRRAGGDVRGEAETLGNLGVLAQNAGDSEKAGALYEASLMLRRMLRDRLGIALMLNNMGELAEGAGDAVRAVSLFSQSAALLQELKSAYVKEPTQALQRLESTLGADRFAAARNLAAEISA